MKQIKQNLTRLALIYDDKHCHNECPMISFSTRICQWFPNEHYVLDLDKKDFQWKSLRHEKCIQSEIEKE
jgi:hypothetical protein